ncbi:Condensation domain-containing protein [Streptosporangium subroseum]|uniref:Condensation domain-containing protein n=1 Tax=Streptosporangium subroseum TaxID=106412 RepID=A0A239JSH5_9ACTN|nr:condensation domain-containing protein [Streptosporangium subroseum]SNT08689.1 Condensation domain-containing protein [Streptosporangium subroseum]
MTGDLTWQRAEPVEFTGTRGGESSLTWGQQAFWRLTRWLDDGDPYFNLPWTLPVYGRRDLGAVLLALRRLVERHETLRTTYEEIPGGPVQRVAREGRFTVEVFEAGEARPLVVARELSAELAAKGFDYATELPFRCAVVTRDGRPRAVAFALTHLAVDGWSLNILATDWRSLLAGDELPVPAWQPLDQAAFEREGAGAARGERAFRHWRAVLGRVPRSLFDFPGETPEEQRFVRVGMESAAVAAAAEVLAERWSVSTASVLTTASAVLLATLTGHREVAMQLIVANRHGSQIEAMVGAVVQDGLFVLDLPEGTFADAVRAGHGQALTTYRHAQYDPLGMMALREEVGRERGGAIDLSAYFNDTRTIGHWPDLPGVEPAGDPAAIAALTEQTRTFFVGAWPKVDATAFFATGPATNTCQLYLLTDTARLPRSTAYALLRGLETLLVGSVAGEVPLDEVAERCGITPIERPGDWVMTGPDWSGPSEAGPSSPLAGAESF